MLTHKGLRATDPLHIAHIFNDYFSLVPEKAKVNIKFSNKSPQDFLHYLNEKSWLFIGNTDEHEVSLIISSLIFAKNVSKNSSLDDSGISLLVFSYRTNLKLHNIFITPKMVKKVIKNLDSSEVSGPDCIPVVVL